MVGAFANPGRGVVLTEFVFQGMWALGGTVMGSGHSPFSMDPLSSGYGITSNLGTIYDPGNPLFSGVVTGNVRTDYQANVGLNPGATLVADWVSGRMAIAYRALASSRIVALNLFPDGFYTADADTRRLVANAVSYSLMGGGVVIPEPASATLAALGLLGLLIFAARKRAA